mmetsp:Transcript_55321/g.108280  ORF Transcript_55321/g.108280 Transcript_55321/m.108280 type:complete len:420 (-) Transcript_55321:68-1327(-)
MEHSSCIHASRGCKLATIGCLQATTVDTKGLTLSFAFSSVRLQKPHTFTSQDILKASLERNFTNSDPRARKDKYKYKYKYKRGKQRKTGKREKRTLRDAHFCQIHHHASPSPPQADNPRLTPVVGAAPHVVVTERGTGTCAGSHGSSSEGSTDDGTANGTTGSTTNSTANDSARTTTSTATDTACTSEESSLRGGSEETTGSVGGALTSGSGGLIGGDQLSSLLRGEGLEIPHDSGDVVPSVLVFEIDVHEGRVGVVGLGRLPAGMGSVGVSDVHQHLHEDVVDGEDTPVVEILGEVLARGQVCLLSNNGGPEGRVFSIEEDLEDLIVDNIDGNRADARHGNVEGVVTHCPLSPAGKSVTDGAKHQESILSFGEVEAPGHGGLSSLLCKSHRQECGSGDGQKLHLGRKIQKGNGKPEDN